MISNQSYQYPVLTKTDDDFSYDVFERQGEPQITSQDGYWVFSHQVKLNQNQIEELIAQNQAAYVVEFDCPKTNHRQTALSYGPLATIRIKEDYWQEGIDYTLNFSICTTQKVTGYRPDNIHEDYLINPTGFDLEQYNLLALGEQYTQKTSQSSAHSGLRGGSIIAFKANEDENSNGFVLDYSGQDIVAFLPKDIHDKHQHTIKGNSVIQYLMVIPILVDVFATKMSTQANLDGENNYRGKDWYQSLYKVISKTQLCQKLDLDKNDDDQTIDFGDRHYEAACYLLQSQTTKHAQPMTNQLKSFLRQIGNR